MIDVVVTPKILVNVKRSDNGASTRLNAIKQVCEMDAKELKKRVIQGLIDADSYPFDYAEY